MGEINVRDVLFFIYYKLNHSNKPSHLWSSQYYHYYHHGQWFHALSHGNHGANIWYLLPINHTVIFMRLTLLISLLTEKWRLERNNLFNATQKYMKSTLNLRTWRVKESFVVISAWHFRIGHSSYCHSDALWN